jgi:mercuric ion transport protein
VHPTQAQRDARRKGYIWAAAAALTCPCHIPIYALLLSGTALGAALAENLTFAFAALAGIFVVALGFAIRLLRRD